MTDVPFIAQQLDRLSAFFTSTVSLGLLCTSLALVTGAVFLSGFLNKYFAGRRHVRQSARIVRELLLKAIDQRSTMEIEFNADGWQGRMWSGPCAAIGDNTTTVAVGLEHSLQSWIGEVVEVFFRLDDRNGSSDHYRFASRIVGMNDSPAGVSVDLSLPQHIHPSQKRSFVRISPNSGHLLGMGLWTLEATQPLPQTHTSLGNAALSYLPDRTAQCSLLNLSASGLRLEVPQEFLQQLPAVPVLASQMLCLLLLRAPGSNRRLPVWLVCTVVNLSEDVKDDAPSVLIGVKFKCWAPSDSNKRDINWFPVGKSGEVPPLASWILRHQLEQHTRRQ